MSEQLLNVYKAADLAYKGNVSSVWSRIYRGSLYCFRHKGMMVVRKKQLLDGRKKRK